MEKRLGIDMGTNSLGWALVEMTEEGCVLLDRGVDIFQEGVAHGKSGEYRTGPMPVLYAGITSGAGCAKSRCCGFWCSMTFVRLFRRSSWMRGGNRAFIR
jgi:hypothetical protein